MSKKKFALSKNTQKNLLLGALTMGVAGILAVCTMCLSYRDGHFALTGWPIAVVWALLSCTFAVCMVYCRRYNIDRIKNMIVLYVGVLLTAVAALVCIRYLQVNLAPIMLCALLSVLLLDKKSGYIALVTSFLVVCVMIVVYWLEVGSTVNPVDWLYLMLKLMASFLIVMIYKANYNRISLIGAVAAVALGTFLLTFATSMVLDGPNVIQSLMAAAWMFISDGVALVLCLVLTPILEWVLRLETNLKLLEYISFDQPLLKELSEKAPGTFHHSLAVGNLAERCANAIGENVNLARAAGYFHDVGKLQSPEFFTENQDGGYNPHDDLTYENSVRIITRHTEVGYQMLTAAHFPRVLADVAREHHGDSTVSYFYIKAKNITEGDVDSSTYRYPGPRPTTRIAAIVMIADTVEAATRSMNLRDREPLYNLIDKLIRDKRETGQFDNCDITMRELAIIRDTLVEALVGAGHKRISYPTPKRKD